MKELEKYFNELKENYNTNKYHYKINFYNKEISKEQLEKIPKILHKFYKEIANIDLPFGQIFTFKDAIKQSLQEPFKSENWFVFGSDYLFSFWLCKYNIDSDGLSFTSWDHNCDEIGEAVYKDLISFLKDQENEFLEFENIID